MNAVPRVHVSGTVLAHWLVVELATFGSRFAFVDSVKDADLVVRHEALAGVVIDLKERRTANSGASAAGHRLTRSVVPSAFLAPRSLQQVWARLADAAEQREVVHAHLDLSHPAGAVDQMADAMRIFHDVPGHWRTLGAGATVAAAERVSDGERLVLLTMESSRRTVPSCRIVGRSKERRWEMVLNQEAPAAPRVFRSWDSNGMRQERATYANTGRETWAMLFDAIEKPDEQTAPLANLGLDIYRECRSTAHELLSSLEAANVTQES